MVAVAELTRESPILEDLSRLVTESHKAVESLYGQAKARIAGRVTAERKVSGRIQDRLARQAWRPPRAERRAVSRS